MNLGSGLTLVPVEGWNVVSGLRVSDQTNSPATESAPPVVLTNGSVVFNVTLGPFSGDANQLLDQTNKLKTHYNDIDQFATTGERVSVTTRQGTTGVVETFTGSEVQGKIAAFVIDGTGVQIVAYGLPDDLATHENDIRDMVESIDQTTGAQS